MANNVGSGSSDPLFKYPQDIKPQSKLHMVKSIATSPTAIKRTFKALAFEFMGLGTSFSPKLSGQFKALSAHESNKVFAQYAKNYFGKPLIAESRNIAKREVLNSNQDFEAGMQLIDALGRKDPAKMLVEARDQPPSASVPDGICAGIRLDVAHRHLVKNENIRDIIESNVKGASAEAAGNQALYSLLDIKGGSVGLIFSRLYQKLNDIGQSNIGNAGPNALKAGRGEARTDFTAVLRAFVKHNPTLKSDPDISKALLNSSGSEFESLIDDHHRYESLDLFKAAMESKIQALYNDKVKNDPNGAVKFRSDSLKQLRWLISFIQVEQTIKNPTSSEAKESQGFFRDLLNMLKSILPSKETDTDYMDGVSDPQHQQILKTLYRDMREDIVYGAVADLRGLKLKNMESVIGSSSLFASDNTFLKGMPNLWSHPEAKDGVYAIDIETGDSAHAITLVIEGQEGYILDPNGIQLEFKSPEEAQHLMRKLLSVYEPPSDKMQLESKDVISHRIALRKFLKA